MSATAERLDLYADIVPDTEACHMQAVGSSGSNRSGLSHFSYTPRSARVDHLRPPTMQSDLSDMQFFVQTNKLVQDTQGLNLLSWSLQSATSGALLYL